MATAADTIGAALVHSNLLQPAELERALIVNDHNGDGLGPLLVRLVNLIINRAMSLRASDIHIEPFENRLKVRYRIDGVLQEGEAPPVHSAAAVISRIKIMAKLNIAENALPISQRTETLQPRF